MHAGVKKKVKYILLPLIVVPLSIIVMYLLFFSKEPGVQDYQANCGIGNNAACIAEEALKQGKQLGPLQALINLETHSKNNKLTLDKCHEVYHVVGSSYYTEFKEEALVNGVTSCFGAYYHGVMQEQGETYEGDLDNYVEQTMELCEKFNKLDLMYCVHGVGHGAYKVSNKDYEKAVELCKKTLWGTGCSAGIFMEIIADDTNAPKFGKTNFDNFQAKDCVIFTNKTLNIACLIETHIDITIPSRSGVIESCNFGSKTESRDCTVYYGIALSVLLLAQEESYTTVNFDGERENLTECLTDEICLKGFLSTPKSFFPNAEVAKKYCLFFIENYGDPSAINKCTEKQSPLWLLQ